MVLEDISWANIWVYMATIRQQPAEAYSDPALYPDPNDPAIPAKWREKALSNYNFLEQLKENTRIQKHETGAVSTINKKRN